MATNTVQLDPNQMGASGASSSPADIPVSNYKFVSSDDPSKRAELYAFRAEINAAEPQQAVAPQKSKRTPRQIFMLVALAVVLVFLVILALPMLTKSALPSFGGIGDSKPPALYIDMGNRRYDPAGLAGRLIVRWEGSAGYELYLDPLDQQQLAAFQTLATNPTHPLSVVIRLLDASGIVACEKQIAFLPPAQPGAPVDPTQALVAKTSPSGDTVQDMAGSDGHVAEITAKGALPCSIQAYRTITAWDFAANTSTDADQQGQQANNAKPVDSASSAVRRHSGGGWRLLPVQFQRLTAAIEGDDVIVGDNPSRGTVDTSSGRVFWVATAGWRTRMPEWQIFPSAVHFRCEKTGTCTLTRITSRTMLQARLVK